LLDRGYAVRVRKLAVIGRWPVVGATIAVLLGALGSCVNDKIVYRNVQFPQPAAAAKSFVGYSQSDTKQTTCGNCHIDQQTKWSGTRHSHAWADLKASGKQTGDCEACHSVNDKGNAATDAASGYTSTKDVRYQDVQCESCHGAGLAHITLPSIANRPLPSIAVKVGGTDGCAECHTGTHSPFIEEWASSRHGIVETAPSTRAECIGCHTAQGALAAFGVNTNYVEKTSTTPLPLTCAVCHEPHDATQPHQLRFAVDAPNLDQNLCMRCHQRRSNPDPTSANGPHSPQGPTLLGTAGWFPPILIAQGVTEINATHGTQSANPKLCATCHVNRATVTDKLTGAFTFQSTGHNFKAIPCLDATGKPTAATDCAIAARTFVGCTASGCHGSEAAARSAMISVESQVNVLVAQLNALIARIPTTEFKTGDAKITTGEGAKFNVGLATAEGGPIHNPFLIRTLLSTSIQQVQKDYGLATTADTPPALTAADVAAIRARNARAAPSASHEQR
jgi:predicted CXXCH cytochrome family protein